MIILSQIKDRIKEVRTNLKLTQEDFGEKIGLSKSGISNIENGTRNVSPRHIKLICSIFDVNESWLRTGIDDDVKFEQMGKDISNFEDFRKYLASLGYSISIEKANESSEGIHEPMLAADGSVLGQEWIPDKEMFIVTLEKDGIKTVLTDENFTEFQLNIEKAVAFELFKINNKK